MTFSPLCRTKMQMLFAAVHWKSQYHSHYSHYQLWHVKTFLLDKSMHAALSPFHLCWCNLHFFRQSISLHQTQSNTSWSSTYIQNNTVLLSRAHLSLCLSVFILLSICFDRFIHPSSFLFSVCFLLLFHLAQSLSSDLNEISPSAQFSIRIPYNHCTQMQSFSM